MIEQQNENKKETINELKEMNETLFNELYILQEEITKNYTKSINNTQINNENISLFNNTSKQINEIIYEYIKLRALTKQQNLVLRIERKNNLALNLGKTLINGVSSVYEFILLPIKLCKLWNSLRKSKPPMMLGGEKFEKVINAYKVGEMQAVENLLNKANITPIQRANAYTELARSLIHKNSQHASIFAGLAWQIDPQPYRLKWYIFRLHESGDAINANALLELLPEDVKKSESEKKHIQRILNESKNEINILTKDTIRDIQSNIIKTKNSIENLNNIIEKYKCKIIKMEEEIKKLKLQNEKDKCKNNDELTRLRLINENIEKDKEKSLEEQKKLHQELNIEKNLKDQISHQLANIIKNLFITYEKEPNTLTQIIRIVFNNNK